MSIKFSIFNYRQKQVIKVKNLNKFKQNEQLEKKNMTNWEYCLVTQRFSVWIMKIVFKNCHGAKYDFWNSLSLKVMLCFWILKSRFGNFQMSHFDSQNVLFKLHINWIPKTLIELLGCQLDLLRLIQNGLIRSFANHQSIVQNPLELFFCWQKHHKNSLSVIDHWIFGKTIFAKIECKLIAIQWKMKMKMMSQWFRPNELRKIHSFVVIFEKNIEWKLKTCMHCHIEKIIMQNEWMFALPISLHNDGQARAVSKICNEKCILDGKNEPNFGSHILYFDTEGQQYGTIPLVENTALIFWPGVLPKFLKSVHASTSFPLYRKIKWREQNAKWFVVRTMCNEKHLSLAKIPYNNTRWLVCTILKSCK